MANGAVETRFWTVKLSPSTVALTLGLLFNALAVIYSAGVVMQRINDLERRIMSIENIFTDIVQKQLER